MERPIIVRGRLSGPRRIDLDEAVDEVTGEVEVVVRAVSSGETSSGEPAGPPQRRKLLDVIRSLPPGARSQDDIDQQLAEERASWGDR
jgi:hypothetical protein